MGVSLSWFAVKDLALETAVQELGLELARPVPRDELPRRIGVGELPDGWLLFLMEGLEDAFEPRFVALSKHGPAVACALEEHVMLSEARGYADGAETWRVTHNSDKGIDHLAVSGRPPGDLERIRREAAAEQEAEGGEDAGVDFTFDVPPDLARTICGFKFGDADPDPMFTELRRPGEPVAASARPGLLQRLFGRR